MFMFVWWYVDFRPLHDLFSLPCLSKSHAEKCGLYLQTIRIVNKFIMQPPWGSKGRGVADRQRGGALEFLSKFDTFLQFLELIMSL